MLREIYSMYPDETELKAIELFAKEYSHDLSASKLRTLRRITDRSVVTDKGRLRSVLGGKYVSVIASSMLAEDDIISPTVTKYLIPNGAPKVKLSSHNLPTWFMGDGLFTCWEMPAPGHSLGNGLLWIALLEYHLS